MALVGVGILLTDQDFNKALNSGYVEFVCAAKAFMLNKDLGILLKEGKDDKIVLQYDIDHPENFAKCYGIWPPHISKKINFGIKFN